MATTHRRDFIRTGAVAAAATSLSARRLARAQGANARIGLGLIGPGGMGMNHLRQLVRRSDAEVRWVCDPDAERLAAAVRETESGGGAKPGAAADLRRMLDDPAVDAVVIATPDHWHVPAALLALEAGKHVYVEKPCSHNIREGRLLVEAAARTGRIVQTGTQSRSTAHVREAMDLLHGGAIGEILVAKAWNSQLRRNIGRSSPADPPAHLDFDTWIGPAPMVPYRENLLPGSWRWWFDFGCGDMGNDGVHDLDIARWGLGVDRHPDKVTALGGKYFFDDDQQFPDTQTVLFEYASASPGGRPRQLIFEQRIWSPYVQEGHENGNAFYGTEGMLILGKQSGWQLFGEKNEPRESGQGRPDLVAHHDDFLKCIREGGTPNADAVTGHLSASLCHLGNIAARTGRLLAFRPDAEEIANDYESNALVRREYREHWGKPAGA